jgi:uncharacterized repeat protein (TIGR03803 family)
MALSQKHVIATCLAILLAGCSASSTPPTEFSLGSTSPAKHSPRRAATSPVVYSFPKKVNDGLASPNGPLFAAPGGTLFGTTYTFYAKGCGYCGPGGVFSVQPSASGPPTVTTIWEFSGYNGLYPETGVVRGADGGLYGTTMSGGYNFYACESEYSGCGVLFKLTKGGSTWSETLLHIFNTTPYDGIGPGGPPLLVSGTLYGITESGGTYPYYYGTLYKESTNNSGYKIIYRFTSSADNPVGSLIMDSSGKLYGETIGGGSPYCGYPSGSGCGTVYSVNADGSNFTVLYAFKGLAYGDGGQPSGYLTLVNGNLFGATEVGGKKGCGTKKDDLGCGTLFELTKSGSRYTESVLYKFSADPNTSNPLPWGMVLNPGDGQLYGTTAQAGDCSGSFGGSSGSCGTIFKLNPSNGAYSMEYQFDGPPDGALPYGPPVIDNGALWGETYGGGSGGVGSIWAWGIPVIQSTSKHAAMPRRI